MNVDAMKQALEALENVRSYDKGNLYGLDENITALNAAIEQAEKQEPVAWVCFGAPGKRDIDFEEADINGLPIGTLLYTTPIAAQRQPLIDSVRQMRDVQGMDGTWNCDPYMHGLYNGLEFAVSLLEQREPQFKDAPEKWLSDLPKPRIFSATEAAHGITGEKT